MYAIKQFSLCMPFSNVHYITCTNNKDCCNVFSKQPIETRLQFSSFQARQYSNLHCKKSITIFNNVVTIVRQTAVFKFLFFFFLNQIPLSAYRISFSGFLNELIRNVKCIF